MPTSLFSEGDVVDAQNSRSTPFTLIGQGVQQMKQHIGTDRHVDFARQTSATLATSLQCERGQQVGRVVRTPA